MRRAGQPAIDDRRAHTGTPARGRRDSRLRPGAGREPLLGRHRRHSRNLHRRPRFCRMADGTSVHSGCSRWGRHTSGRLGCGPADRSSAKASTGAAALARAGGSEGRPQHRPHRWPGPPPLTLAPVRKRSARTSSGRHVLRPVETGAAPEVARSADWRQSTATQQPVTYSLDQTTRDLRWCAECNDERPF